MCLDADEIVLLWKEGKNDNYAILQFTKHLNLNWNRWFVIPTNNKFINSHINTQEMEFHFFSAVILPLEKTYSAIETANPLWKDALMGCLRLFILISK